MKAVMAAVAALTFAIPLYLRPADAAPPSQWGFDLSGMDTSAPRSDFYRYANGKWLARTQIPDDQPFAGVYPARQAENDANLDAIIKEILARPAAQRTPGERKLAALYRAFIDTARIAANGLAPAQTDLAFIEGLKSKSDIARAMGSARLGCGGLFALDIDSDAKDPNVYAVLLNQSGLGMPDRDFYRDTGDKAEAVRTAYRHYLAAMLALAGGTDAEVRASKIYALEQAIADAHWSIADSRNVETTYNPMTVAALKAAAPSFDWTAYFAAAGIAPNRNGQPRAIIVAEKTAVPALAKLIETVPVAVWRDYLAVRYLHAHAEYLPDAVRAANFAFYRATLEGRSSEASRDKGAVRLVSRTLPDILGKLYVDRYFPPQSKAKAEALVATIFQVYREEIRTRTWLSQATRKKALEKLQAMKAKVGYPDHWQDYASLDIREDDLVGNIQRARQYRWERMVKRLDGPVDKGEWFSLPSTVDAYYNVSFNNVRIQAGILLPPYFDPAADDAVNYGAIGAMIGHEISHGFDDRGSKYDSRGILAPWWSEDDRRAFDARTAKLIAQYDQFEPLPGVHVNGKNTLSENIADLSGLSVALKAYHRSLGGRPAPTIDGFSGDQRFFLSYAQMWRIKLREGALRTFVRTNEHAPMEFRVLGAVRNLDAWYDAFEIQPGDPNYLRPEERVTFW